MGTQARRWCFTLNNPRADETIEPDWTGWEDLRFGIYQAERGEAGTPHYQGYLAFTTPKRLGAVRRLIERAHWEPARGTEQQNIDYCTKDISRLDGPWTMGERGGQGKRNDLADVKQLLDGGGTADDIAQSHFGVWLRYRESLHVYQRLHGQSRNWQTDLIVICGPPGSGKSRLAHNIAEHDAFWFAGGNWWDGYHGQRCVVIDEFSGGIPWHLFLRLADRYPLSVEVKGGTREFVPHSIIITSNRRPEEWYSQEKFGHLLQALYRRISLFMWLDKTEELSYVQQMYDPQMQHA